MLPDTVEKILSAGEDAGAVNDDSTSHGLLMWAEALAGLAGSKLEPGLSLESEMKLAGTFWFPSCSCGSGFTRWC